MIKSFQNFVAMPFAMLSVARKYVARELLVARESFSAIRKARESSFGYWG
jgi:hypothetical protein